MEMGASLNVGTYSKFGILNTFLDLGTHSKEFQHAILTNKER